MKNFILIYQTERPKLKTLIKSISFSGDRRSPLPKTNRLKHGNINDAVIEQFLKCELLYTDEFNFYIEYLIPYC